MKTILFAWELGAGLGHLMRIHRLARHLQSEDVRLIAAVTDISALWTFDDLFTEVHRMPSWPISPTDRHTGGAPSSATMTDMLVNAGIADTDVMGKLLKTWDKLFRTLDPALVVADYAPAAALTARSRIPLLIVGNGFTVPPAEMAEFPPLHTFAPPVCRDEDVLLSINAALRACGLPLLDRLPQIFSAEDYLIDTLALLDPYNAHRRFATDGPLLTYSPRGAGADADLIFLYLSHQYAVSAALLSSLEPFASRLVMHAPALGDEERHLLVASGAVVEEEARPLETLLPKCRLVVHFGGSSLTHETLLAGVPQLVLSTHIEQDLTGRALQNAGLGIRLRADTASAEHVAKAIGQILADDGLRRQAAATGERYRSEFSETRALNKLSALYRQLA